MNKKRCGVLPLILSLLLLLSACGGQPSNGGPTAPAGNADASDSSYPISIDNYGREVVVERVPQKVLALGPNCAELLVALGLEDSIIGTSLRNHSRGPLPEFEAAFEQIPEINHSSATREAVIGSGADFIYGIDWEFGDAALDIEELAGYGITVYVNSATTLEEQYQEILDIGKIFGVEEAASAYVEDQKARIEAIQSQIDSENAPKVLVYDSGGDGVFTCSGINFESLLIEMAGGINLFDDLTDRAWVTVSYEEVIAREPDVILIHDYDSPSVEEKIAEIKANDVLAQLDCVQNDRFAVIELESVLPGNRMAYTIERLYEVFYE